MALLPDDVPADLPEPEEDLLGLEPLLLDTDLLELLETEVDLPEETLPDLLGDDVSTLLVFTVLSGVEPEFLLVIPFTCLLGVNSSTLLWISGFGFGGGGVITTVRGRYIQES